MRHLARSGHPHLRELADRGHRGTIASEASRHGAVNGPPGRRTARQHESLTVSLQSTPPPPEPALFPSREARARCDAILTEHLADAHERVMAGAVTPTVDLAAFKEELAGFDFRTPRKLDDLLPWIIGHMEHGIVHLTNPRYFGLYNPAPTFPAQCADRIAAVFNPQLATATSSPVPVALEAHVVRAVARRAGLPDATGHFTTGGAEANYTALICALTRACPEFAQHGARAFAGPPVFYVSSDSHLAWLKIAHQAGIGRSGVRLVDVDARGRMDLAALAAAIETDRAGGAVPVMIAATAGTTNAGMIDPLAACAAQARENGLWFHVDAAWGGALIACETSHPALAGIEMADSLTIDAHKWFATTMGCGIFITTDHAILSSAFQVATTYMPSNLATIDPYVTTMQWSRRFLGLRLFLALGAAGWSGYAAHVGRSIDLIALLRGELEAAGWTIANESPVAVLCCVPPPGSAGVRCIVERVLTSGRAWVSVAVFGGREILRACVTHGETTEADIHTLVSALRNAAVA
jgi:glutamate/tyrosine decarboxylase-like PLP-dependent enzyme